MRRLLVTIVLLLLPFVIFGLWVRWGQDPIDESAGVLAGLPLLKRVSPVLALLVLGVVFILRRWVLPRWGQKVAEKIYMGGYFPGEDRLLGLVAEVGKSKDEALMAELVTMVHADPGRVRGWQELARLYEETFHRIPAALDALAEGAEAVVDPQDKALLYYRAAQLSRRDAPENELRERRYLERAAAFENTVYGQMAQKRLS